MKWLLLVLAGTVLCTFGDYLHARQGVLAYHHPFWSLQAIWVPPEFAIATLAALMGARRFVRGQPPASMLRVVTDGAWFMGAYAYTSFAEPSHANVTLAALAVAWALHVIAQRRSPGTIVWCVVLAICGCLAEGTLSRTGAFWYVYPDVYGVPRWLPGIYLHAGIATASMAAWLQPSVEQRAERLVDA